VLLTPPRAPNANACAEGWVGTVRAECLDWRLIVGRGHLEQVLRVSIEHDNSHRPRAPAKSQFAPNARTCLSLEPGSRPGPTRSRAVGPRPEGIGQIGTNRDFAGALPIAHTARLRCGRRIHRLACRSSARISQVRCADVTGSAGSFTNTIDELHERISAAHGRSSGLRDRGGVPPGALSPLGRRASLPRVPHRKGSASTTARRFDLRLHIAEIVEVSYSFPARCAGSGRCRTLRQSWNYSGVIRPQPVRTS
jgi:hypothetical protein